VLVRLADELTAPCEVLTSCWVGEQSVVSDAHQSGRQDVEQEAAEKLLHVEGHEPFRVASCAVVPAKGHAIAVEGDESLVGDGHAVGVAAEVAQHLPGSGEGRLAVDDPVFAGGSSKSSVRVDVIAAQGLVVEARLESAQQLGAEELRQDPHGKQKTAPGRDPTAAIRIEPASCNDAMDVRMKQQGLSPTVQHTREADLGAEVLRVTCHVVQRLRDRGKEQAIAASGISAEQGVECVGHGEDDVVILDGQQMLLLSFEPAALMAALAFGTVPIPAGVVGNLAVIAAVALMDVTAELRGTAVEDSSHHACLPTVETRCRIAALTEDVGQLEFRSISTAVLDRRARHASVLR